MPSYFIAQSILEEMNRYLTDVEQNGFTVIPDLLDPEEVGRLVQAISRAVEQDGVRKRGGVYAIRNLLEIVPETEALARCPKIVCLTQKLLGDGAFPVKGTLFDKTADANWLVHGTRT